MAFVDVEVNFIDWETMDMHHLRSCLYYSQSILLSLQSKCPQAREMLQVAAQPVVLAAEYMGIGSYSPSMYNTLLPFLKSKPLSIPGTRHPSSPRETMVLSTTFPHRCKVLNTNQKYFVLIRVDAAVGRIVWRKKIGRICLWLLIFPHYLQYQKHFFVWPGSNNEG